LSAAAFKRDFRRAKASSRYRNLEGLPATVLELLVKIARYRRGTATTRYPGTGGVIGIAIGGPTCC
jgi:hypothetical protein